MSFKDIKGQNKAIGIIKENISNARLGLAYLFSGPEGTGKKLTALTLAQALNCASGPNDACGTCASCVKIAKNQHPDVYILDAASALNIDSADNEGDRGGSEAIKISQIRALQKNISLRPYEGRVKVFIIDNAHNLTPAASGAFLKILEEPPQNSLIILITSKPNLLFKTIISRCRMVKFYSLPPEELEEIFKTDYAAHKHLAHFLAYFCEGRLGRALALRETDILKDKNRIIDKMVFAQNPDLAEFSKNREELRAALNILISWFRDLYILKSGLPDSYAINSDRRQELTEAFGHFSFIELESIMKTISDSILYLNQNLNTRLLLSNLRAEIWKG